MLQLHAANDPWLRRLETFEFEGATEELIPFVPLLLSPKTTEIYIRFLKDAVPIMVVASTIAGLSKLCPDLERITLMDLPRDPIITEAASDLLLACNRDTLQAFCVDSPLTEKAQEIVCQLPGLSKLWVVIQGSTSLPVVALPNLTMIDVEYDDLNWLQGFRGVTLEKLESVTFSSQSEKICDPLGTFESIALAASAQKTLSEFRFETSRSWNPNYSALLSFHQLKEVAIQSSCKNGCSSRVDDNIIMSMARAMPMLETLQLGDLPCNTPAGITVNGLVGLARLCPRLSGLCIHFQAATLLEAATSPTALFPSDGESVVRQEACALTDLVVERIPIPEGSGLAIAHILLQIFPHILNVRGYAYRAREWRVVADTIDDDIRELDPSYIPQVRRTPNTYPCNDPNLRASRTRIQRKGSSGDLSGVRISPTINYFSTPFSNSDGLVCHTCRVYWKSDEIWCENQ